MEAICIVDKNGRMLFQKLKCTVTDQIKRALFTCILETSAAGQHELRKIDFVNRIFVQTAPNTHMFFFCGDRTPIYAQRIIDKWLEYIKNPIVDVTNPNNSRFVGLFNDEIEQMFE